jgi:hypothetical protein
MALGAVRPANTSSPALSMAVTLPKRKLLSVNGSGTVPFFGATDAAWPLLRNWPYHERQPLAFSLPPLQGDIFHSGQNPAAGRSDS